MPHIIRRIVRTVTTITWTIQWQEEAAADLSLAASDPVLASETILLIDQGENNNEQQTNLI